MVSNAQLRKHVSFERGAADNRGASRIRPAYNGSGHGGKLPLLPTIDVGGIERRLPPNATLLLKLDIEGCEHAALRTGLARRLLQRTAFVATERVRGFEAESWYAGSAAASRA